jgi:hypothetical protein
MGSVKAVSSAGCATMLGLLVVACSSSTEVVEIPAQPTTAHYQVAFPSTNVAVTTETMQVFVFDATDTTKNGTDCLTLITKRRSGGDLPADALKLFESEPASPCDLLSTTVASDKGEPLTGKKGALATTYGNRSFLVVTRRAGADYFLGCTTRAITSTDTTVEVALSPADATISVPASMCASLSDKCAARCS